MPEDVEAQSSPVQDEEKVGPQLKYALNLHFISLKKC